MSSSEQPAARAWRSFMRAKAEAHRVVHRELRERGLSGAQFSLLRLLAESGSKGAKLNEISHRLWVTGGNVTGLVDRLEEAGLLARMPHPDDRRITLAMLTPAGRELFEQIHPAPHARVEQLMSGLTEEEQIVLADLLTRLAERAVPRE